MTRYDLSMSEESDHYIDRMNGNDRSETLRKQQRSLGGTGKVVTNLSYLYRPHRIVSYRKNISARSTEVAYRFGPLKQPEER